MQAEPEKVFRREDLVAIGIPDKTVWTAFSRLHADGKIVKVANGAYKFNSGSAPPPAPKKETKRPTRGKGQVASEEKVMAFVRKHPGELFRVPDMARAMGMSERTTGIAAACYRLFQKGDLEKVDIRYRLPADTLPPLEGLEAVTANKPT